MHFYVITHVRCAVEVVNRCQPQFTTKGLGFKIGFWFDTQSSQWIKQWKTKLIFNKKHASSNLALVFQFHLNNKSWVKTTKHLTINIKKIKLKLDVLFKKKLESVLFKLWSINSSTCIFQNFFLENTIEHKS